MKGFIALILLALSANAFAVDECFTGSWYDNTTADGRGIDIQVLDDKVVGYYYTWYGYDRELFLLNGENDDEFSVELTGTQSLYTGTASAGTAQIDIIDNNNLLFSHDWRYDHHATDSMHWCFTACKGEFEYVRLTQPIPCD